MQPTKERSRSRASLKSRICERLKLGRIESGFATAKEFAEKNDLKISTYTLHEAGTRSMSLEVMEQYADILNVNVTWLLTGAGPRSKTQIREIPIIQWDQVMLFPKGIDFDACRWTAADTDLTPLSFALRVDNDAMEPRYPEGTIIIVDCQQKPLSKDFAIIALKDRKIPLFKQIVLVEGDYYAKSLNPDYPAIRLPKNALIIGKVIQAKLMF